MIGEIFSLTKITEETILFIQQHQYLIAALTPFLVGELTLHGFGILNGSGDVSIMPFLISLGSVIIFDTLTFYVVRLLQKRYNVREKMRKVAIFRKFETVFQKCEARYSRSPVLLLLAVKLVPMTKITIIFFSLWGRMSLKQFLLWDVIISVVYSVILFVPGWFVGKELLSQTAGRNVASVILYLLIVVVLTVLFGDKIEQLMLKLGGKIARMFNRKKKEVEEKDVIQ